MIAIGNNEKCPYCDIIITEDIDTVDHLFSKHPDEANEALFGNKSEEEE